jgi:hypothetical protein
MEPEFDEFDDFDDADPVFNTRYSINDVAFYINERLHYYGWASLTEAEDPKTGQPTLEGMADGHPVKYEYKGVIVPSKDFGLTPSAYIHLVYLLNEDDVAGATPKDLAEWNARNRFAKLVEREGRVELEMDAFIPATGDASVAQSVAEAWNQSLGNLAQLKSA